MAWNICSIYSDQTVNCVRCDNKRCVLGRGIRMCVNQEQDCILAVNIGNANSTCSCNL